MTETDDVTFRYGDRLLENSRTGFPPPCPCEGLLDPDFDVTTLDHVCARTAEECCRRWVGQHLDGRIYLPERTVIQGGEVCLPIGTDLSVVVSGLTQMNGSLLAGPGQPQWPIPTRGSRGASGSPLVVLVREWWFEKEIDTQRTDSLHEHPLWGQASRMYADLVLSHTADHGPDGRLMRWLAKESLSAAGLPRNPGLADHLIGNSPAYEGVLMTVAVLTTSPWDGDGAQALGHPHDDVIITTSASGNFTRAQFRADAVTVATSVRKWWYGLASARRVKVDGRNQNAGGHQDDNVSSFVQRVLNGEDEADVRTDLRKYFSAEPNWQEPERTFTKRLTSARNTGRRIP